MKGKISSGIAAVFLMMAIASIMPIQACVYYGYTPGFWKNRGLREGLWPTEYSPTDSVRDVFGNSLLPDITLLEALQGGGGSGLDGAIKILLRAAVAGLLNEGTFGASGWIGGGVWNDGYMYTKDDIIDGVNDAVDTGDRDTILDLAEMLDIANNMD